MLDDLCLRALIWLEHKALVKSIASPCSEGRDKAAVSLLDKRKVYRPRNKSTFRGTWGREAGRLHSAPALDSRLSLSTAVRC